MALIHYNAITRQKEKLQILTQVLDRIKKDYETDTYGHFSASDLIPIISDIVSVRSSIIEFKSHILISIEHMLSPQSVLHQLKPEDNERTIFALNKKMHECETSASTVITQLESLVKLLQEPNRRHADITILCQSIHETIGTFAKQIENLDWLSYVLYNLIVSKNKTIAPTVAGHSKELFWFDNINSWQAHPFAIRK